MNRVLARGSLDALVVTRAGKSRGDVLIGEGRVVRVIGKRGPDDLCISEQGSVLPREGVVCVGVQDLDDVVTIGAPCSFACVSSLSVATRVTIVVSVGTCVYIHSTFTEKASLEIDLKM